MDVDILVFSVNFILSFRNCWLHSFYCTRRLTASCMTGIYLYRFVGWFEIAIFNFSMGTSFDSNSILFYDFQELVNFSQNLFKIPIIERGMPASKNRPFEKEIMSQISYEFDKFPHRCQKCLEFGTMLKISYIGFSDKGYSVYHPVFVQIHGFKSYFYITHWSNQKEELAREGEVIPLQNKTIGKKHFCKLLPQHHYVAWAMLYLGP